MVCDGSWNVGICKESENGAAQDGQADSCQRRHRQRLFRGTVGAAFQALRATFRIRARRVLTNGC